MFRLQLMWRDTLSLPLKVHGREILPTAFDFIPGKRMKRFYLDLFRFSVQWRWWLLIIYYECVSCFHPLQFSNIRTCSDLSFLSTSLVPRHGTLQKVLWADKCFERQCAFDFWPGREWRHSIRFLFWSSRFFGSILFSLSYSSSLGFGYEIQLQSFYNSRFASVVWAQLLRALYWTGFAILFETMALRIWMW